jgi:endonuclease YncB( thermonuclease family)
MAMAQKPKCVTSSASEAEKVIMMQACRAGTAEEIGTPRGLPRSITTRRHNRVWSCVVNYCCRQIASMAGPLVFLGLVITPANLSAAPDLMTCQNFEKIKQIATLETPRGPASGQLCLVDGATFSIGPTWVRLDGLKAPSMGRFCSRDTSKPNCKFAAISVDALADLLVNGVACQAMKTETRGRWLATCKLPDGRDLGTEIVRLGFACAATAISSRYAEVETQARTQMRGLWAPQSGYDLASDCALKTKEGSGP